MNNYIVGIDISSSKVCGVVGRLDQEKKIQIVGITTSDYEGIKDNVMLDEEDISYILRNVVERLKEIVNSPLEEAYLSVPISLCEIVKTKGVLSFPEIKEISKEDILNVGEVARFCVGKEQEIVQVDIEEYIVDSMKNITNPLGMKGKVLESEGNAFILSKKYVDGYKKCLKEAGIEVKGWVVNAIGIGKDIIEDFELAKGVAVIDIGSSNMEVTVFKNNRFLDCFSVPLGGKNITNDISICLKLSLQDSERLKFKCNTLLKENSIGNHTIKINTNGDSIVEINYEMLVDIIGERVKELLEIISKRIEKEQLSDQIGNFVIVGGGISLFRDITTIASELLGKPVRIGVPNYVGAANPIYSTATGIIRDVLSKEQLFNNENSSCESSNENLSSSNNGNKENKFITRIKGILKSFSNEEVIK
ncbi:cell division protein FtsA [uncultured Clostridium sp.]|uniref:cell division protein FtsA n=1 Tax=uncultured Clostridium sp. TaxID=59620 RepID=UPI003216480A